jgi:CheY-like chemotaxis protein
MSGGRARLQKARGGFDVIFLTRTQLTALAPPEKLFLDTPARQTLICFSGAPGRVHTPREPFSNTDARESVFARACRVFAARVRPPPSAGRFGFPMSTPTSQTDRTQAGAAAGEQQPAAAVPARILLVEDDPALRRYLGVVLRRGGYEVAEAADGIEALKLALSSRFSLVVTDAVMPRLGGPELRRLLRARSEYAALPVVLLTGLDAGAHPADPASELDARLTKPVRTDELLDCVAHLLARAG